MCLLYTGKILQKNDFREGKMNCSRMRLSFFMFIMIASCLIIGTMATAGIVVEEKFITKLNGTSGVITKIEGNRLTLKTDKGELVTFGVTGESQNDKNIIRSFKTGDRLRIENGKATKISASGRQPLKSQVTSKPDSDPTKIKHFDPQPEPPGVSQRIR